MNFDNCKETEQLCGICGERHSYSNCNVIEITKQVPDGVIPTKARLTLPDNVSIKCMADGSSCVIAKTEIGKGTQFGPLEAQKLLTLNPSVVFPLKIFNNAVEELSECYLDTSDENNCNWMIFVTPAQNADEQNLLCFQEKFKIYFVALKNIEAGNVLKVWYSPYYAKKMKKNILASVPVDDEFEGSFREKESVDLNDLLKKQQNLMERENWTCKFCGKLDNNVPQFAIHILEHYQRYRKHKRHCENCKQSFPSKRMLSKHFKVAHSKEIRNLKKTKTTDESVEKVKIKDSLVGGPLLNDMLNDSIDNTNLVLPSIELNQLVIPLPSSLENQAILLENDSLSLNVDNLLTENVKELDHFNFEIGESQEQHVCDICLKGFARLDYLIQHLKKHTGKFTCLYCLKIFCRSENLNSHKCNVNMQPQFICSLCQKGFMLKKYLTRHVHAVHNKKYTCENCNKKYHSSKEYKEHNCSSVPDDCKSIFACVTCNKKFFREIYLRKHMATHAGKMKAQQASKDLICEFCAQQFSTTKGLQLHKKIHLEPNLECKICNKKFYRKDVLSTHMLTHGEAQVNCTVCNAKLRTKQTLAVHMLQHSGRKSHACKDCPKTFYQRSTLVKHHAKMHLKTCPICKKRFETSEQLENHKSQHNPTEYYVCPFCDNKLFKLKSSLNRHIKQCHTDQNSETAMAKIKPRKTNLPETNPEKTEANADNFDGAGMNTSLDLKAIEENDENFGNIVENFENIINSYSRNNNVELLSDSFDNDCDKNVESSNRILDLDDFEMELETNFEPPPTESTENREICLSMPDLTEGDQEIRLGANAYMLDNGTIVEQKDQSNVLVYVLDKKFLN